MKIGLISDTHGNTAAIDQAVELAGEIDLWLHAGDMIHDAEYLDMAYDAKVVNVAGNCDWGNRSVPEEEIVEAEGHRIFLTHGHIYGVKGSPYGMVQAAEENGPLRRVHQGDGLHHVLRHADDTGLLRKFT